MTRRSWSSGSASWPTVYGRHQEPRGGDRRRRTGGGGLRVWLFGIATNLVAQHRRKEARRYKALARTGSDPAVGSHEDRVLTEVTAGRMRPQLARALAELSPGERDVVLLVALADLERLAAQNH